MVRLEPLDRGRWQLGREDRLRGHVVPPIVAGVLVAGFRESTPTNLAVSLSAIGSPPATISRIVDWLLSEGYLVDPAFDQEAVRSEGWLLDWSENNWRAAAWYHARTYGYPFEFYEVNGRSAEDARRMTSYNREQPDTKRAKGPIVGATVRYPLPGPTADQSDVAVRTILGSEVAPSGIDHTRLLGLLALLTRPIRTARMPFPGAAEVLRKTSPSGGSRHPTEFYLVASGIGGVIDGVYQVAAVDGELDSVEASSLSCGGWLSQLHLGATTDPWALVIYTSMFERNRYRYREPRTFRTVHMDVGHLMTTCESLARANGWTVHQVQHLDGVALAAQLSLDPYVECPIAATFISGPHTPRPTEDGK